MSTTKRVLAVKVCGDTIDRFREKVEDEARTQSGVVEKLLTAWLDGKVKL